MEKGELEQQLKPDVKYSDYVELLDSVWQPFVEKSYSFIVKNEKDDIVAVALNFDANDQPVPVVTGAMLVILEFLEFIDSHVKYAADPTFGFVFVFFSSNFINFVFLNAAINFQKTSRFCIHC